MIMSNIFYDFLRRLTLWIPIIAVFYATLSEIWGFPCEDEVLRTFIAIDAALNALVSISNAKYKKLNRDDSKDGEKIDE